VYYGLLLTLCTTCFFSRIDTGIQKFLAQVKTPDATNDAPIVALVSKAGDDMCSLLIQNGAINDSETKCKNTSDSTGRSTNNSTASVRAGVMGRRRVAMKPMMSA